MGKKEKMSNSFLNGKYPCKYSPTGKCNNRGHLDACIHEKDCVLVTNK